MVWGLDNDSDSCLHIYPYILPREKEMNYIFALKERREICKVNILIFLLAYII